MPVPKIVLLTVDEAKYAIPSSPPCGLYLEIDRQRGKSKWARDADAHDAKWMVRTIRIMRNDMDIPLFEQDIAKAFAMNQEYLFILLVGLDEKESEEALAELGTHMSVETSLPTLDLAGFIAAIETLQTPQ